MKTSDAFLGPLERGLRVLIDGSSTPMLVVASGYVVHVNASAAAFFQLPATELLGRTYVDLVPTEARDGELSAMAAALSEGSATPRSFVLSRSGDSSATAPLASRVRVESAFTATLYAGAPAALVRLSEKPGAMTAQTAPEAAETRRRVLVVDDEIVIGNVVRRILRDHDVVHVTNAEQAAALLQTETFDVILCDVMMPGMSGVDLFEMVCREHPPLRQRFVFVTGGAFTKRARDFLANVPNPRIDKPFEASAIRDAVTSLSALPH